MHQTEAEMRRHRCSFTGHRPEKIVWSEKEVSIALQSMIADAYVDGFSTFITGMARGVDIWAAEAVIALRREHPDVRLICALPHPNFEKGWETAWQTQYNAILRNADLVKTICSEFSMGNYQKRNEWMVDHSACVIAVYHGGVGGTWNTIEYAYKQGIEVRKARVVVDEQGNGCFKI